MQAQNKENEANNNPVILKNFPYAGDLEDRTPILSPAPDPDFLPVHSRGLHIECLIFVALQIVHGLPTLPLGADFLPVLSVLDVLQSALIAVFRVPGREQMGVGIGGVSLARIMHIGNCLVILVYPFLARSGKQE